MSRCELCQNRPKKRRNPAPLNKYLVLTAILAFILNGWRFNRIPPVEPIGPTIRIHTRESTITPLPTWTYTPTCTRTPQPTKTIEVIYIKVPTWEPTPEPSLVPLSTPIGGEEGFFGRRD